MEKNKYVLYLEMYLYAAKKLIIKKNCTLQDLEEAEMYLNKCRGIAPKEETRIDVWLGKLEFKRSKLASDGLEKMICLNNAKDSFFVSIDKKPTPSAYYGLFKTCVSLNDLSNASLALIEYEKSDKKKRYNFRLVHKLLDSCMGITRDYPLVRTDYIFGNRVDCNALIENFHLAEMAFDSGELNKCLKHLNICQKLAKLKGITIDFLPVIELAVQLISIKNLSAVEELKQRVLSTDNFGERILIIRSFLSFNKSPELYFLLIDSYIGLGGYACIPDILEELKQLELTDLEQRKILLYENIYQEQLVFSQNIMIISRQLDGAQMKAESGDLKGAYACYVDGLNGCGHSIFLSKLGDLFYANGYYGKAEEFYLQYLAKGYENLYDVYVGLYKIYRHLDDIERATSIATEGFNSLLLATRGYTLETWIQYLESEYEKEGTEKSNVLTDSKQKVIVAQ